MGKIIIRILLITIIDIVSTASLSYYVASQPNQTQNNLSQTPTPTPTPIPTPTPTLTPTPTPSPSETPTEPTSIPKPSVPEFTVKYVDNSYYVQPTTTTDPYTGETVTQGGFYGEGEPEIEITIKNQHFTGLRYQVRTKGHFSQDWSIVEYWIKEARAYNPPNPYPEQDYTSEYTILKFGSLVSQNIPSEGQIDIQVQALKGHVTIHGDPNHAIDLHNSFASFEFTGETSGWSNTQTITIT